MVHFSSTGPDFVRVCHFEEVLMKVRIVRDRTSGGFLPDGGFTLMLPSWRGRQRMYSCWFATRQEAVAYVAARPTLKGAYEKDVLGIC